MHLFDSEDPTQTPHLSRHSREDFSFTETESFVAERRSIFSPNAREALMTFLLFAEVQDFKLGTIVPSRDFRRRMVFRCRCYASGDPGPSDELFPSFFSLRNSPLLVEGMIISPFSPWTSLIIMSGYYHCGPGSCRRKFRAHVFGYGFSLLFFRGCRYICFFEASRATRLCNDKRSYRTSRSCGEAPL